MRFVCFFFGRFLEEIKIIKTHQAFKRHLPLGGVALIDLGWIWLGVGSVSVELGWGRICLFQDLYKHHPNRSYPSGLPSNAPHRPLAPLRRRSSPQRGCPECRRPRDVGFWWLGRWKEVDLTYHIPKNLLQHPQTITPHQPRPRISALSASIRAALGMEVTSKANLPSLEKSCHWASGTPNRETRPGGIARFRGG